MAHERTYVGRRAYFPDLPRGDGRLGRFLTDGDTVEFADAPPADDTRFVTKTHKPAKKTAAKPEESE